MAPFFLLLSDHEFRKLMMDLTNKMMEERQDRQLHAARLIGRNTIDDQVMWVMSENVQINTTGQLATGNETPVFVA